MIEIKRASRWYGQVIGLNDVSCSLGPGITALLGENGAGKTTIIKMITGQIKPTTGTIEVMGYKPFANPEVYKRLGYCPEIDAMPDHSSGRGFVYTMARMLGMNDKQAKLRTEDVLETVKMADRADRKIGGYSKGMRQRVKLAQAIAHDPQVLLLDEPFSAVDQVTRRRLQHELAQMRQRLRIPIVLVTHDLEEAAALADRMVVLHRGATLQSGPPLEVLARPRDALVARLVDFRNLYHGEVVAHDPAAGTTRLRWGRYELEASHQPAYAAGARICWGIQPAHCVLHRRDRPSRGERENPVSGVVGEYLPFGENAAVTLWVDGRPGVELRFSVPTHVAARNGLAQGVEARVSLLREALHFMPYAPLERPQGAPEEAVVDPARAAG